MRGLGNQNEDEISAGEKLNNATIKLESFVYNFIVMKDIHEQELEKLQKVMEKVRLS